MTEPRPVGTAPASTCPHCKATGPGGATSCPRCGRPSAPAAFPQAAGNRPETSTLAVQNVLLIVGALLLTGAALAFAATGWDQLALGPRTALLSALTLLALALPVALRARGLTATAEATVTVAFALCALDGYLAYRVGLAGVDELPGPTYAGMVAAGVAAVAGGYGLVVPLRTPRPVAVLALQAIGPLLALGVEPQPLVFGFGCALIAALNVAVWPLVRGQRALMVICVLGATTGGLSALVVGLVELAADTTTGRAFAAAGLLFVLALILLVAGMISRDATWCGVDGALAVVLTWVTAVLLVARTSGFAGDATLVMAGGICLALSVLTLVGTLMADPESPTATLPFGARVGGYVVITATLTPAVIWAILMLGLPLTNVDTWDSGTPRPGVAVAVATALAGAGLVLLAIARRRTHHAIGLPLVGVAMLLVLVTPAALTTGRPVLIAVALIAVALFALPTLGNATPVTDLGYGVCLLLTAHAASWASGDTGALLLALVGVLMVHAVLAVAARRPGARLLSTALAALALLGATLPAADVAGGERVHGAFALAGTAALLTAVACTLARPAPRRSRVLEALALFGAATAVLLAIDHPRATALLITGVGLVLIAVSARPDRRAALWTGLIVEVLAAVWWMLAYDVRTVEAVTVPLGVALLILGVSVQIRQSDVSSWISLGPGLVVGLLPSLLLVLGAGAPDARALALGVAALGLVVVGAFTQKQAPFTLGVSTLVLVAARLMIPRFSDVPVWIPLAVAGITVLMLGATFEQRRRDVRRLGAALGRMR